MADPIDDKSDKNKPGEGGNPNPNPDPNPKPNPDDIKSPIEGLDIKDPVAVSHKLGELQKTITDFDDYKKRVEPILKAIYSDPKVFATVNIAYQKAMGVKVTEDGGEGDDKDKNKETPKTPDIESDNRSALITQAVQGWEGKHGIDKMKPEEKAALNTKVLTELKGMLDPMNTGKTGADLLAGVSVANVPSLLDKAFYLATREEHDNAVKEQVLKEKQNEDLGLITSIPSGSISESSVKLSEKEKGIAKKQGITEEKYLANKIEILKRKGSIA